MSFASSARRVVSPSVGTRSRRRISAANRIAYMLLCRYCAPGRGWGSEGQEEKEKEKEEEEEEEEMREREREAERKSQRCQKKKSG